MNPVTQLLSIKYTSYSIKMESQIIREIKETDYPVLVEIWESAVLHTHDFLKQEDFLYYKENLINYFRYVSLYGFEQDQKLVGFIGTANSNIEMLFVHNDYRSMGIGKNWFYMQFTILASVK